MPRISVAYNFQGEMLASQPWVLSQIENINNNNVGVNNVFVVNTLELSELNNYVQTLNAFQGNLLIVKDGSAKGVYVFIDNSKNYQKLISEADVDLSVVTEQIEQNTKDISQIVEKTNIGGELKYKIKASVLPQIAITKVYHIDADKQEYKTYSIEQLFSAAITENSAQTGDVVVIYASKQQNTQYAGNYIITNTLTDISQITSNDYIKLYTGNGSVVSVNGIAPVNGNIILSVSDLNDIEISKDSDNNVTQIKIHQKSLALKDNVDSIFEKHAVAIQRAVQMIEQQIPLINGKNGVTIQKQYEDDGMTVKQQMVTIQIVGRVLMIWDQNGKMIIPQMLYDKTKGITTLSAKYGKTELDEDWTILKTSTISIENE